MVRRRAWAHSFTSGSFDNCPDDRASLARLTTACAAPLLAQALSSRAPQATEKSNSVFDSLSLPTLVLLFAGAAAAVWIAGVKLSNTTDVLSARLGLGEALGGLILLAIVTNLPEIAITASAALSNNLGVAIGNILGGIAIQTVVLVVLDVFGVRGPHPLTYRAASLVLVLEGALLIAVLWVVGLLLLNKARSGLPWQERGEAPESQEEPRGHSKTMKDREAQGRGVSTGRAAAVFGAAALVTLGAGVVLERSGDTIAGDIGMSGVLFGATSLAAATSLPEVSTGITSVRLGDYKLAVSDIFGGNAFLPVLFLMASLLSGQAVLPQAQDTDIYLTGLGILLTAVYIWGLVFRPRRRIFRMGIDSLLVLILYAIGIVGLIAVTYR